MTNIHVFTDGSANPQHKVGYGAYLIVSDLTQCIDQMKRNVKLKRFEQTSSTKLEIQTILWALNDISARHNEHVSFSIYTDCQNIINLPDRKKQLEHSDYHSSKNKPLNNAALYKEFYQVTEKYACNFIKVIGHQANKNKNKIDKIFELVDRQSRHALREHF